MWLLGPRSLHITLPNRGYINMKDTGYPESGSARQGAMGVCCPKCEKEEVEDVARTRLFPGHQGRVRQSWHWSICGERPWIALGRRVPSTWCPRGSSSRTKHSGRDLDPPWCHLCCRAGRLRADGPVGSRDGKLDSSFRGCPRMPELWFPDGQLGRLPRWVWGWSSDVRII